MKDLKMIVTSLSICLLSSFGMADTLKPDALIIYSKGAAKMYGSDVTTQIDHLIATTNKIYKDSGLDIELNPVKVMEYDKLDDTKTSSEVLEDVQKDQYIKDLRDKVGADEVIIYRPYANDGVCGIAYQNNSLGSSSTADWAKDYTYAHVSIDCPSYTTAHEVGHNMGLGHSYLQGSEGAYKYARGHGVVNEFVTVMAYQDAYNAKTTIYKFSSPKLDCDGYPCGVEEGNDDEADAVKALVKTVPYLVNFRESVDTNDNASTDTDDNATDVNDNTDNGDDLTTLIDNQKKILDKVINKLDDLKADFLKAKQAYIIKIVEYKKLIYYYRRGRISYDTLKNFYYNELVPAYDNYKNSYNNYVDYYNNVYIVEFNKLKDLLAQL